MRANRHAGPTASRNSRDPLFCPILHDSRAHDDVAWHFPVSSIEGVTLMANTRPVEMIQRLCRMVEQPLSAELSDRELLSRFAHSRDEQAFGQLVQRHAGLVYGVCQRVLQNTQDAEDAFQAVFLVLARKANSHGWHETIGSWLYQTATRVALKLRGQRANRALHTTTYADQHRASTEPTSHSDGWQATLDEELQRLPERYRLALLQCYVLGQSQEEAATALGWTEGALRGRLFRARELLRERLNRRGCVLASSVLGLPYLAVVPALATVLASTTEAAGRWATHQELGGLVSATTLHLTRRTIQAMLFQRIKTCTLVTASLALLGTSIAYLPARAQAPREDKATAAKDSPITANVSAPQRFTHPDGVHGFIEKMDVAKANVIVALEENRKVRLAFEIAPSVAVRVAGQPAKLADLKAGHEVIIAMCSDLKTVATIDATVKRIEVALMKVDPASRQITFSDDDDDDKPVVETVNLGREVLLYIDDYLDSVDSLAECEKAVLEYAADGKTIARIQARWQRPSDLVVKVTAIDATKGEMTVRVEVDDGDDYAMTVKLSAKTNFFMGGRKMNTSELKVGQTALVRMADKETVATLRMELHRTDKDED